MYITFVILYISFVQCFHITFVFLCYFIKQYACTLYFPFDYYCYIVTPSMICIVILIVVLCAVLLSCQYFFNFYRL